MKSNLEGCVRMCDNCPKRADRAVFLDPAIVAQISQDTIERRDHKGRHFPEIDPLDVDHATINRVASLADYGKKDADFLAYLTFSRQRSTGVTLSFPISTTLDMIGACSGPQKVRRGLFRTSLSCGAYEDAMQHLVAALGDDPAIIRTYTDFLEQEDRFENSRRVR